MDKLDSIIPNFFKRLQDVSNSRHPLMGLPSGFAELDRITGGFEESDLIVIGARPLMGKTIFVIQLLLRMTRDYNIPVLFFSLDMSAAQLVSRILSSLAEIENTKFRCGCLSANDWEKLVQESKYLDDLPLFIHDQPLSIEDLCDKAKAAVRDKGIRVIFIDYLQLLSLSKCRENRYQDIAYCTRTLKALAKELNVPVIVTSQLNRNVEYRPGNTNVFNKPELHDLRDSGTICEDANLVILLDRPELTQKSRQDSWTGEDIHNVLEVIIAKNNSGREDVIKMRFKGEINKIEEWIDEQSINNFSMNDNRCPNADDILSDANDTPF